MAAGKLVNLKRTFFVGKVTAQEGFEAAQIKFFAGSNGCRMVQKVAHGKP
jgi:hypothetical protein